MSWTAHARDESRHVLRIVLAVRVQEEDDLAVRFPDPVFTAAPLPLL
jgi:hypothetical protein